MSGLTSGTRGCTKPQDGPSVPGFALDELIVGRAAPEPDGQHFLQDADDILVEDHHAARGQLLEASDGV